MEFSLKYRGNYKAEILAQLGIRIRIRSVLFNPAAFIILCYFENIPSLREFNGARHNY